MKRRLSAADQTLWNKVITTVIPLSDRHGLNTPLGETPPDAARLKAAAQAAIAAEQPATTPTDWLTPAASIPPAPTKADRLAVGPKRHRPPPPAPPARPPAHHPETLDASWDKKLASGKVQPDFTIDLHGMRREAARELLYHYIALSEASGARVLLVITGKGGNPGPSPVDHMHGLHKRGAIKTDLPRWLGESALSPRIAAVRKAHPRHGGSGAVYLILRRKRG